jgi:hypothetical protein
VSRSLPGTPANRADWIAHRLIIRVWHTMTGLGAVWLVAINVAFFTAVLREFAPELLATVTRVLARGG